MTVIDTEVRAEAQILPGQEQEEHKAAERRLDTSPVRGQRKRTCSREENQAGRRTTSMSCHRSQGEEKSRREWVIKEV